MAGHRTTVRGVKPTVGSAGPKVPDVSQDRLVGVRTAILARLEAAIEDRGRREGAARAEESAKGLAPGTIRVGAAMVTLPDGDRVAYSNYARTLWTGEMCEALADDLVEWSLLHKDTEPWITAWCVEKGLSTSRVDELVVRSKRLEMAMQFAKTILLHWLLREGTSGKLDSRVVVRILSSWYGMSETERVGTLGPGVGEGLPSTPAEVDRRIAELQEHKRMMGRMGEEARQLGSAVVSG